MNKPAFNQSRTIMSILIIIAFALLGWSAAARSHITIQDRINEAEEGEHIVIEPGVYNEDINFYGKNIVLTSREPRDPEIVKTTIIRGTGSGSVVTFDGAELTTCVLAGFTITGGYSVESGGGISGNATHATIHNNIISTNTAILGGGGIFGCNGIIRNNRICNNQAETGGGIYFSHGEILNNIIYKNESSGPGGGIAECNGKIQNNVLWGNFAQSPGSGIAFSTAFILNSIICGNIPSVYQIYDSTIPIYSCIEYWDGGVINSIESNDGWEQGEGNIFDDPLFVNPSVQDFHLQRQSPCIDAGLPELVFDECLPPGMETARCDMGAYGGTFNCDWNPPIPTITPIPTPTSTPIPTDTPPPNPTATPTPTQVATPTPTTTPTPTCTPTPSPTPTPVAYWFEDFECPVLDTSPPQPMWERIQIGNADVNTTPSQGLLHLIAPQGPSWGGVKNCNELLYENFSLHTKIILADIESSDPELTTPEIEIRFRADEESGYSLVFTVDNQQGASIISLRRIENGQSVPTYEGRHHFYPGEQLYVSIVCENEYMRFKVGNYPSGDDILLWELWETETHHIGCIWFLNNRIRHAALDYVYAGLPWWDPFEPPPPPAPRIASAILADYNGDGIGSEGENLTLVFDQGVTITKSLITPESFYLPVKGDSLGSNGFKADMNPWSSRELILTLGTDSHLTIPGDFQTSRTEQGSPSGIDIAAELHPQAIYSFAKIPAIDGGVCWANDTGVDIKYSFRKIQKQIGTEGGMLSLGDDRESRYKKHSLLIPPRALGADVKNDEKRETLLFEILPPDINTPLPGAVWIRCSNENIKFTPPATLILEYLESDVDEDAGLSEAGMRICRLVIEPDGSQRWVPLPGVQRVSVENNTVSVEIESLADFSNTTPTPFLRHSASSQTGIFGNLPGSTIEENTIFIRRQSGGKARIMASANLLPKSGGAYTLHRIEFPNYVQLATQEPDSIKVTIKTATLLDRVSRSGGNSMPTPSSAIFLVNTQNSSNQPIPFNEPVNIRVQFMNGSANSFNDLWRFDNQAGEFENMSLVKDFIESTGVNFNFIEGGAQRVYPAAGGGYVEGTGIIGLTDSLGKGVWGAVAKPFISRELWMVY
ncbi:MAG: hypothetical protein BWY12_02465 [candidate division BRC1 bacterium ADurb.Bin183]|nr:MAG: hypothetical protein BWY12_02465 [candidate division BRC1 bacterium ADurb.Bin183]